MRKLNQTCLYHLTAFNNAADRVLGQLVARHPVALARVARAMTFMGLLILIDCNLGLAYAAGANDWFSGIKTNFIIPAVDFIKYIFFGAGLVTGGTGIWKLIQTSRHNAQVTPVEAGAYCLGGGALMGIGFFAEMFRQTMTNGNGSQLIQ